MPEKSIKTHHCRFCNHLLLATTRDLSTLPRRREPGRDAALVLPLPVSDLPDEDDEEDEDDEDDEEKDETEGVNTAPDTAPDTDTSAEEKEPSNLKRERKDHSILLSTTLPDRRAILVRRDDGFEKRTMLRCGRCRVVVGYFLDKTHFEPPSAGSGSGSGPGDGAAGSVVYILPGALVDTGDMGDEQVMKMVDREWSSW